MLARDIADALDSHDPAMIHDVLRSRIEHGSTKDELIAELTTALVAARSDGRTREEDLLLDGLDALTGWTSLGSGL